MLRGMGEDTSVLEQENNERRGREGVQEREREQAREAVRGLEVELAQSGARRPAARLSPPPHISLYTSFAPRLPGSCHLVFCVGA